MERSRLPNMSRRVKNTDFWGHPFDVHQTMRRQLIRPARTSSTPVAVYMDMAMLGAVVVTVAVGVGQVGLPQQVGVLQGRL